MKDEKLFDFIQSQTGKPLTDKEKKQATADDLLCKKALGKDKENVAPAIVPAVIPARRPIWNTLQFRYFVAVFLTSIVCLSIFLPLVLRSDNPNGDDDLIFTTRPTNPGVFVYCYDEFRSGIANMNALYFTETSELIPLSGLHTEIHRFTEVGNEDNTLGYSIQSKPIVLLELVKLFNINFRVLTEDATFVGQGMYKFLPNYFSYNDVKVLFVYGPSQGTVHFIYDGLAYYIGINRPTGQGVFPDVSEDAIRAIVANLFTT